MNIKLKRGLAICTRNDKDRVSKVISFGEMCTPTADEFYETPEYEKYRENTRTIATIKELKDVTGLGLKGSKELYEILATVWAAIFDTALLPDIHEAIKKHGLDNLMLILYKNCRHQEFRKIFLSRTSELIYEYNGD